MTRSRYVLLTASVALLMACSESADLPEPLAEEDESPATEPAASPTSFVPESPARLVVPNLRGQRLQEAVQEADDLGLRIETTKQPSGKRPGTVLNQTPLAGSRRQPGAVIRLVVAKPKPPPPPPAPGANGGGCHSSYTGACLDPNASDYDCAGGSGDGPKYTGTVQVVGPDVFGLDGDGDGIGCE